MASLKKSKVMAVDRHRHAVFQVEQEGKTVEAVRDPPRILVRGELLEVVVSFVYLGSLEHSEGRLHQAGDRYENPSHACCVCYTRSWGVS